MPGAAAESACARTILTRIAHQAYRRPITPADMNSLMKMYAEGHKVADARPLPLNLLDAVRELERDEALAAALGRPTVEAYARLKRAEWTDYMRHFTAWERANSLDC